MYVLKILLSQAASPVGEVSGLLQRRNFQKFICLTTFLNTDFHIQHFLQTLIFQNQFSNLLKFFTQIF